MSSRKVTHRFVEAAREEFPNALADEQLRLYRDLNERGLAHIATQFRAIAKSEDKYLDIDACVEWAERRLAEHGGESTEYSFFKRGRFATRVTFDISVDEDKHFTWTAEADESAPEQVHHALAHPLRFVRAHNAAAAAEERAAKLSAFALAAARVARATEYTGTVADWMAAPFHPAPACVVAAKRESGLTWSQFQATR